MEPRHEKVQGVVAVITAGPRLLVVQRSSRVIAPLKFCFPGGGVLPGETETDALRRELREELGVEVVPRRRLWQSVTPWQVSLGWWLAELSRDAAVCPDPAEIAGWGWYLIDEIEALDDLLESNRHFFQAWRAGAFDLDLPMSP